MADPATLDTAVAAAVERLAAGAEYGAWLAALGAQDRSEVERHYEDYEPREDDIGRLRAGMEAEGGLRILAVVNPESPDTHRGVPVFARVAEAMNLALRIVPTEANEELIKAFPDSYGDPGPPTFVFLNDDGRHLGQMARGPQQVEMDINKALQERFGYDYPLEGPEHDAVVREYIEGPGKDRERAWRHAQLWETLEIVSPETVRMSRGTIGPSGLVRRS